jgi:biopolymer transport protein ExbB/TolQ/biopolymer transport protein ExbD
VERANGAFSESFRHLSADLVLLVNSSNGVSPLGDQKVLRNSSLYRIFAIAAEEIRKRTSNRRALSAEAIESIRASMDAGLVRENQRLTRRMVLLTIAISGGPFLGLLGTVVGVMITFAAIAAAGDVNVNAIAPGIAAALVATVAGLGVAIPALFGYNWLLTRVKDVTATMQVFVDELVTKVAEAYAAGAARESGLRARPRPPLPRSEPCVQSEDKPYDDINITPMLDLSYVLLVIFVIMTTATVQGMRVNLPKAGPAKSLAKSTTTAITVTQGGQLFLDTIPVSLSELEQRLVQQRSATPEFPVVVRGDGGAQYQSVIDVLDLLARLNITTVGLATKPLVK